MTIFFCKTHADMQSNSLDYLEYAIFFVLKYHERLLMGNKIIFVTFSCCLEISLG